jgi:hypothetical protein
MKLPTPSDLRRPMPGPSRVPRPEEAVWQNPTSIPPKAIAMFRSLLPTLLLIAVAVAPALADTHESTAWPREIAAGDVQVTIYQPQVERFEADRLEARAAVSVRQGTDGEPVFGAVWLSGRVSVDREARTLRFRALEVPEVRFADATDDDLSALAALLEARIPQWDIDVDIERFVTDLDDGSFIGTTPGLRADPPQLVHSSLPAVLLQYDGEPRFVPLDEVPGVERVINTMLPVLREAGAAESYLFGGERLWYRAADPEGPWAPADRVPSALLVAVEGLMTEEPLDAAVLATPPAIITATKPTELIVTQGDPKWVPIGNLDLLYCDNTDADVFLDIASQRYFILLAGRWYAGTSVQDRILWVNVPNDQLPNEFASIPEDSVNGHVLAHVAGTTQAREEALQNAIPQTAAVRLDDDSFSVDYDGEPVFEPVQELEQVRYAVNTGGAVFVADGQYWACEDGVWYTGAGASGPWRVATSVPDVLYRIPPSNPHYNVTYVHVYETTPEVVYVGYTPGYVGSYWYHGTVVWGTGWYYRPWYRGYYYRRPWTWGLGIRYNPWFGWGVGITWSNGPFTFTVGHSWYRPPYYGGWYGPWGYRPPYYRPYPPPGWSKPRPTPYGPPVGRPGAPATRPAVARPADNLYARPTNRDRVVTTAQKRDRARPSPAGRPNDVLTDFAGNVYRRDADGRWQVRDKGNWRPPGSLDRTSTLPSTPQTRPSVPATGPAERPAAPTTRPSLPGGRPTAPGVPSTRPAYSSAGGNRPADGRPSPRLQLENDYRARTRGAQRVQQRPPGAGARPAARPAPRRP